MSVRATVVLPIWPGIPSRQFERESWAVDYALAMVSQEHPQVTIERGVGPSVYDFDSRHIVWVDGEIVDKGWVEWRDGRKVSP